MTRHKKPKTYAPQATDSPAVRRRKRQRMFRHIDKSEDYPIAVWSHRWEAYVMDDRPGLYRFFSGDARKFDTSQFIAAFDTFQKKWGLFCKLSDDETAEKIEKRIEYENIPF